MIIRACACHPEVVSGSLPYQKALESFIYDRTVV
jgi:hypothetical protein